MFCLFRINSDWFYRVKTNLFYNEWFNLNYFKQALLSALILNKLKIKIKRKKNNALLFCFHLFAHALYVVFIEVNFAHADEVGRISTYSSARIYSMASSRLKRDFLGYAFFHQNRWHACWWVFFSVQILITRSSGRMCSPSTMQWDKFLPASTKTYRDPQELVNAVLPARLFPLLIKTPEIRLG